MLGVLVGFQGVAGGVVIDDLLEKDPRVRGLLTDVLFGGGIHVRRPWRTPFGQPAAVQICS